MALNNMFTTHCTFSQFDFVEANGKLELSSTGIGFNIYET